MKGISSIEKFVWHQDKVLNNLEVKQLYAIAYTEDYKILLRIDDNKYK